MLTKQVLVNQYKTFNIIHNNAPPNLKGALLFKPLNLL